MHPLECIITVSDDLELVEKVFSAEDKSFKNDRSSYSLKRKKNQIIITITANDPTALRATVTSVTRILNIVRKTRLT